MRNFFWIWVTLSCAAALVSCSSILAPQPDPSRYYLLNPSPRVASASGEKLSIGLGPIAFPGYLKRPEVVTQVAPDRFELSKIDRWAAPLDERFAHVLSADLASQLAIHQVLIYPWWNTVKIDYQVQIEVDRFNSVSRTEVELSANWSISDGKSGKLLYSASTTLREPFQQGNTEASAEGMSRTVDQFASQIAQAIRALHEKSG
jgi:uncharacterized lipoprotein YmbA